MNVLSRREFLRVSSLAAATTLAAACVQPGAPAAPAVQPVEEPTAPPEAPAPSRYSEAPMLADLVAAGELPPVDERLPENPYIAITTPGWEGQVVGKYGGTLRRGFSGVSDRWGPSKVQETGMAFYSSDLTLHPCLAESWEINEDASVWTWHLRRGTRWSDGYPFTAEAFTWYWQYQLLNEDLTATPPEALSTGEPRVLAELETPDDFTAIIKFAAPKPLHAYQYVRGHPMNCGHYMAQFHVETTEDAAALEQQVQESGLPSWSDYFNDRNSWFLNPDRPSINPWVATNQLSSELFLMERNPYFWKVDPEGQQLPYIDRVTHRLFETTDVFNMWIVNGEIDFQSRHVSVANFTLFKESEEKGDYRVYRGIWANHEALQLNLTTKEPKLREFFQTRDVRLAISNALNRQEINDIVYDGLAKPRQYSPLEQSPNYYAKLSDAHLEYDPERANQLLDEAGYTQRDAEGYRTHKDGSPLSFTIEGTAQPGTPTEDAAQMVVTYLAAVGIKAAYKYAERSLYEEHYNANEIEAATWGGDRTVLPLNAPGIFTGTIVDRPWGVAWGLWKNNPSNPNGEEPPEGHWMWTIWDLWARMITEPVEEKRNELFQGILDIWAEELPMIGILGQIPQPVIVKNGFTNYLEEKPVDDPTKDEHLLQTETCFWEDPENHV